MSSPSSPLATRSKRQPPANWYPTLSGLNLPQQLTDGVTQGFQLIYAARDKSDQNSDAINHLVMSGAMQDRLNAAPTALPQGALWFVTDYPDAVYQVRVDPKMNQLAWFYATGVIWRQPSTPPPGFSLGLNDAGFMVVTTAALSVWDGTQWVQLLRGA